MTETQTAYGAPPRVTIHLEHWPDASLSPNARKHWRAKEQARKAAIVEAQMQVWQQERKCVISGRSLSTGDELSIDGASGRIYVGLHETKLMSVDHRSNWAVGEDEFHVS